MADVAFIVDSSGSIGRRNWVKMLQFVKDMVKAYNVGPQKTHIAVIAYSTGAKVEFKLDRLLGSAVTEEGYYKLIDRIRFQRSYTFIDKALLLANEQIFTTNSGMRPHLPQVLKFFARFFFHVLVQYFLKFSFVLYLVEKGCDHKMPQKGFGSLS